MLTRTKGNSASVGPLSDRLLDERKTRGFQSSTILYQGPKDQLDAKEYDFSNHMTVFKRRFTIKVILTLFTIFGIFFQAFFYSNFYMDENKLISSVQSAIFGEDDVSMTMRVLSYLIQPFYIHLLILHITMSIYYNVDPIIGAKLMVNNLILFSMTKLIMLFHQEPRPYWLNTDNPKFQVDGYGCIQTYSDPDMSVIQLMGASVNFLIVDAQLKRLKSQLTIPSFIPYVGFGLALVVYIILYIGGEAYLSHFVICIIYTLVFANFITLIDPQVCKLIRMCTFEAKKYFSLQINYFLLFLIAVVTEVLLLMGYNSRNLGPKSIFNYVAGWLIADPVYQRLQTFHLGVEQPSKV